MATKRGSDNRFPLVRITYTDDTPATPPADEGHLVGGVDKVLRWIDDDGTVTELGSAGTPTTVATDTIWDAAGDLAVGSGSDTAARLALGAAGGAVSRVNGAVAWNSGTSFPTAATGDRYWRTDRGLEYYYDGTRWLCTCLHQLPMTERVSQGSTGHAAGATLGNMPTRAAAGDMYLVDLHIAAFAGSATQFDASNYWTVTLDKLTTANASTNIVTKVLNSVPANEWRTSIDAINAVVSGSAHVAMRVVIAKTNSPGNLVFGLTVTYRQVG